MLRDERGIAMLTVVMVLLMLTVLGIAAITVSGLENNMAGLQRTMEASSNAAESCLGTGANIIQQVFLPENGSEVPTALLDNSSPPGPVPNANKTVLENELIGNPENITDAATGTGAAPNLRMTGGIGPYAVAGDIDRLYVKMRAGTGQSSFRPTREPVSAPALMVSTRTSELDASRPIRRPERRVECRRFMPVLYREMAVKSNHENESGDALC